MVKIKVRIDHLLFLDAVSVSGAAAIFLLVPPDFKYSSNIFSPFQMMVVVKWADLDNITLPVSLGGYLHNAQLRCGRFYRQFFIFFNFCPFLAKGPKMLNRERL